jgi:heme/copper-type cytochrome/quinol oxidase subunit 3
LDRWKVSLGAGLVAIMHRAIHKPVLTERDIAHVGSTACFWHLIGLPWFVLFVPLYLIAHLE